jgi:hypothetical protein
MTHLGVYSTGLTVDGVDWTRTDLRILARVTTGLHDGLEVRGVDYTIPGTAGQVPFGRMANQLTITAEGLVMGQGADEAAQRADFLATRRTIYDLMRGDRDPYTLEVTLEDGSTATIDARPLRVEWGPEVIPTYREFIAYWLAVGDATGSVSPEWTFSEDGS